MKQTLVKIIDDHYVVVDDSEIKEGDWYIYNQTGNIEIKQDKNDAHGICACKKITHSTQPLEWFGGEIIFLSEVKELIGEVNVDKDYVLSRLCVYDKRNPDYIPYDEDDELKKPKDCSCDNCFYSRTILSEKILQLNQALEDNKDKKYTEEDVIRAIKMTRGTDIPIEVILKSLQPKTEWEVTFDEQGKLRLV